MRGDQMKDGVPLGADRLALDPLPRPMCLFRAGGLAGRDGRAASAVA
jgi:hypothetical protein